MCCSVAAAQTVAVYWVISEDVGISVHSDLQEGQTGTTQSIVSYQNMAHRILFFLVFRDELSWDSNASWVGVELDSIGSLVKKVTNVEEQSH